MSEFFYALTSEHDVLLRAAVLTGLLASIGCGVVGSYVVTRRITYIAGSIAHCVLGGMGAARFCQVVYHWQWAEPLLGALAASLLAAGVIGLVTLRVKEREDTVIGAVWAVGMAIGVLFISRTPGYGQDLMSYLFGSLLLVSPGDLWLLAGLDVIVLGAVVLFYKPFLAVCFDGQFARIRGLHVEAYYVALLCLTALTVVLLISVVGIVMVIALLTIPAAIAGQFSRTLWQMMVLATALSILFITGGLALSYGPDLPSGATTIVLAGAAYLLVLAGRLIFRRATRG